MRMTTHIAALLLFATVACLTVALQVRIHLRGYQLGRSRAILEEVQSERDLVQLRVDQKFTPAWVHRAAQEIRARRRASMSFEEIEM